MTPVDRTAHVILLSLPCNMYLEICTTNGAILFMIARDNCRPVLHCSQLDWPQRGDQVDVYVQVEEGERGRCAILPRSTRVESWLPWQEEFSAENIPDTVPGTDHSHLKDGNHTGFDCYRCGQKLCEYDDVYKFKNGAAWVIPSVFKGGLHRSEETAFNKYKKVSFKIAFCSQGHHPVGTYYPQSYDDDEDPERPFPIYKLDIVIPAKGDRPRRQVMVPQAEVSMTPVCYRLGIGRTRSSSCGHPESSELLMPEEHHRHARIHLSILYLIIGINQSLEAWQKLVYGELHLASSQGLVKGRVDASSYQAIERRRKKLKIEKPVCVLLFARFYSYTGHFFHSDIETACQWRGYSSLTRHFSSLTTLLLNPTSWTLCNKDKLFWDVSNRLK